LDGLRDLVHDARHQSNRQLKRDTGFYGQPAKVVESDSLNIRTASEAIYDLYIAGRTLGTLLGKELPGVALMERETGNGHLANAALCERLAKIVPQEKTVREAVSSKRCMAIWRKCRESLDSKAGEFLKSKGQVPTTNGHGTARRRRKVAVA